MCVYIFVYIIPCNLEEVLCRFFIIFKCGECSCQRDTDIVKDFHKKS